MMFTRDMNDGHTKFVFGSNEAGRHGAGAAFEAKTHWDAVYGVGFGPTGDSFAIPTMDWEIYQLPLPVIRTYVERFLAYARLHYMTRFLVTPIGTGLCGYTAEDIKPMFAGAPNNCVLPEGW